MLTMQPILPIGPYDWEKSLLPQDEFDERLAAVRAVMVERNWRGMILFGSIADPGAVTYITNFTPKLGWGMVLLPVKGDPALLADGGPRMLPAAQALTYVTDLRPARNPTGVLTDWLDEIEGDGGLAVVDFAAMPHGVHRQVMSLDAIVGAEDGSDLVRDIRRRKSARENALIDRAAEILGDAAGMLRQSAQSGEHIQAAIQAAEAKAFAEGAQDVRALYSLDGGCNLGAFESPEEVKGDQFTAFLAVKYRGYWAEGLLTIGNEASPARQSAAKALAAMTQAAVPGASADDLGRALNNEAGSLASHSFTEGSLGNGSGLSLTEAPFLDMGSDTQLAEGDIITLRAGLSDDQAGHALLLAMLRVGAGGPQILYSTA